MRPHGWPMSAGEPVDYDRLEEVLRALAYSSRLELLGMLRTPRAPQDLRLAPGQTRPGENPDRTISRQAIQAHLDKLVEIGVVAARERGEPGGRGKEYVVNTQRMYQFLEELRKIATLTPSSALPREDTIEAMPGAPARAEEGPHLLLVHGLAEGKVFPLRRADLRDGRGWILGRKPGLHVSLEYDPFVSVENAEIVPRPGGFELLDLRSSKNGTWLNFRRLGKEERVALRPGDVVGAGRTFLVFRDA
jgi:DNA-binding transcriptional ArsR family regulator